MCWSAQVSLNTYVFSTFACFFAFFNGILSLIEVVFLQSFICMQLLEHFIWAESFSNTSLSQIGLGIILCQPIFSILCVSGSNTKYIPLLLGAYGAFLVVLFLLVKPFGTIDFKTVPGPNGHLAWHWLDFPLYAIILWLGFFLIRHVLNKDYINMILIILIVGTTYLLFHKSKTWGSLWCWVANGVAFMLVVQVFWRDLCV
jgi:hypothetical protein